MNGTKRMNRHQRGVGLIEVLVAVLVLSIGLLGLAGLQLRSVRNNESALERGMAVVETHAIADAMRADRANARNGLYDIALTGAAPAGATFRETVLREWRTNLINALGADATGSVDCTDASCVIIIQWDDTRGTQGIAAQRLQTEVQI
jgi:type IV pilus assembly protein PilV